MLATAAGWMLPDVERAILRLEAFGLGLGQMNRQFTVLKNLRPLKGIEGIAIGQYSECGLTRRPKESGLQLTYFAIS